MGKSKRSRLDEWDPNIHPFNAGEVADAILQLTSGSIELNSHQVGDLANRLGLKPPGLRQGNEYIFCDEFKTRTRRGEFFHYSQKGLDVIALTVIQAVNRGIPLENLRSGTFNSEAFGLKDFTMVDELPDFEETLVEKLERERDKPDGSHEWPAFITPEVLDLYANAHALLMRVESWVGYPQDEHYKPDSPVPQHLTEPEVELLDHLYQSALWLKSVRDLDSTHQTKLNGR